MNDCNSCVLLFYSQCGSLITSTLLQNLSILVESASKSCCKKHHCELLTLKSTWTAQSCVRPFLSSTICAQKPPLETSMNQLSRTATSLATMSPAWNKILLPIHRCVIICSTAMSHMLNDAVPSTMLHCLCIIVDIFLLIVLFLAWQ